MESFKPMSTEEIKSAKETELAMMKGGAEVDEKGQLIATEAQIDRAHASFEMKDMNEHLKEMFPTRESYEGAMKFISSLSDNPALDKNTLKQIYGMLEKGIMGKSGLVDDNTFLSRKE